MAGLFFVGFARGHRALLSSYRSLSITRIETVLDCEIVHDTQNDFVGLRGGPWGKGTKPWRFSRLWLSGNHPPHRYDAFPGWASSAPVQARQRPLSMSNI